MALVEVICVSFRLGLIWSTHSFFSDIAHEELEVETYMQRMQFEYFKLNLGTFIEFRNGFHFVEWAQNNSYNQDTLYATLRSSVDYVICPR